MAVGQIASSAIAPFPASQNRRGGLSMTSEGAQTPYEWQEVQNFPSSRRTSAVSLSERTTLERLRCRFDRRPQFCDQPQDVGEQVSWDCDLGHLKRNITPMASHEIAYSGGPMDENPRSGILAFGRRAVTPLGSTGRAKLTGAAT
jgi:hypothetical protein